MLFFFKVLFASVLYGISALSRGSFCTRKELAQLIITEKNNFYFVFHFNIDLRFVNQDRILKKKSKNI